MTPALFELSLPYLLTTIVGASVLIFLASWISADFAKQFAPIGVFCGAVLAFNSSIQTSDIGAMISAIAISLATIGGLSLGTELLILMSLRGRVRMVFEDTVPGLRLLLIVIASSFILPSNTILQLNGQP